MKKLSLFVLMLITSVTLPKLSGQVVGEKALGLKIGVASHPQWPDGTGKYAMPVPIGLSYMHVITHHDMVELHVLYDKFLGGDKYTATDQKEDKTKKIIQGDPIPMFKSGNLIFGFGYQPFLHAGNRDVANNLYLNFGFRLRLHLDLLEKNGFEFSDKGYTITPEIMAGVGYMLEIHEAFELFFEGNLRYYSPFGKLETVDFEKDGSPYTLGYELNGGLRIRLNYY